MVLRIDWQHMCVQVFTLTSATTLCFTAENPQENNNSRFPTQARIGVLPTEDLPATTASGYSRTEQLTNRESAYPGARILDQPLKALHGRLDFNHFGIAVPDSEFASKGINCAIW